MNFSKSPKVLIHWEEEPDEEDEIENQDPGTSGSSFTPPVSFSEESTTRDIKKEEPELPVN